MLRGSDIVGVPIRIPDNEQASAQVLNWILDLKKNRITGFLTTFGGWSGSARIIMWQDITRITSHSLEINKTIPIIDVGKIMSVKQALENPDRVIGLDVITGQNDFLGVVGDIYFDENSGVLLGLESYHKRNGNEFNFIPMTDPMTINDELIIVPSDISFNTLQEDIIEQSEALNGYRDNITEHRVKHDIRDDTGYIIIPRGYEITPEILDALESG